MASKKESSTKKAFTTAADQNNGRPTTADEKAARNAARLEKMRANLAALESSAAEILQKDTLTSDDRKALLRFINVAYHDSGKIEGAASIDGSASCEFCEKMRAAAEVENLIICGFCYAAADAWKEAAWRRHKLNARIFSTVLFTADELKTLAIPADVVRINEDGDVVNVIHARNILRIIKAFSKLDFGFWYKNVPAVAAALDAEGIKTREQRPRNVRFVQSSIYIGFPARPAWFTDVLFTVYPDEKTTIQAVENGAWECNGRKCNKCGWNCYKARKNSAEVQHVAEFLRTNKEQRAQVLAAYNMKKEMEATNND